ncbi:hypothetical protein WYI_22225 [Ochrobactrum sp. CDB2]|nr:hypothetical protein WYI_22225 [Ochrobactrum sp. CDB2]
MQKRSSAARDLLLLLMAEGLANAEPAKQRLGFDVKRRRLFAQSIARSAPVPPSFNGRVPAMKLGGLPQEFQRCDQREGWHRCGMRRSWNGRNEGDWNKEAWRSFRQLKGQFQIMSYPIGFALRPVR